MTAVSPDESPSLAEEAEHRLRRWLGMEEMRQRLEKGRTPEMVSARIGPYLTISREEGAGASEIAKRVGDSLGWEVLDRELLDFMAEHYHLPRNVLEFVDETTANWLHEAFSNLIDRRVISQQTYVKRLGHIVLLAAYHGKVVLVGRGAQFLLPPDRGLTVRILAPEKYRIEQIMQRHGMTSEVARKFIEERERGRRDFVSRYFHQDHANPHLYDLVVNVAKYGPVATAELIVAAVRCWLRDLDRST